MIFVTVSTGHFDPLIEACDKLKDKYLFFGQIGMGSYLPKFSYVKTLPPDELHKKMEEAELVISHAGTGMLSRLYQLKKKTIVIPKQAKYGEANNGQVELAEKWEELGIALLCMDVKDLEKKIEEAKSFMPVFPVFPSLGGFLREEWTRKLSVDSAA